MLSTLTNLLEVWCSLQCILTAVVVVAILILLPVVVSLVVVTMVARRRIISSKYVLSIKYEFITTNAIFRISITSELNYADVAPGSVSHQSRTMHDTHVVHNTVLPRSRDSISEDSILFADFY